MRKIITLAALVAAMTGSLVYAAPRSFSELKPVATIKLGKAADWVAIANDAVWVGSKGPFTVNRIDPRTNKLVATVALPGDPCAGLAIGFKSLWVPLCGTTQQLAQIDLVTNRLTHLFNVGPAAKEGGIAASEDSLWLLVDKDGSLARIDPNTGATRQTIKLPAGSYNPLYSEGRIFVTRAEAAELTSVDAKSGSDLKRTATGPGPRFLTASAGAVWTLNQGDGTVTRIDSHTGQATKTIAIGTPGAGGDIKSGGGMIWSTMLDTPLTAIDAASGTMRCQWTGPGGDSLNIGFGAIWITDLRAGTISKIALQDALSFCKG